MKIAVDAMGGDNAPDEVVRGAARAAKNFGTEILLVGDEGTIENILKDEDYPKDKIEIKHASQVILTQDKPTTAIRQKKDSSMVRCLDLLEKGEVGAVVSAGNTGALMMGAIRSIKRLPGVSRPALAAVLPNGGKGLLLLDSGANTKSKPINLIQFAYMGKAYAEKVMGIDNPRVGILSNGAEEGKGTETVKEAYKYLKTADLNFIGNVEGREVLSGNIDVLVCDGFSGNILLKSIEGVAEIIFGGIKGMVRGSLKGKIGGLLLRDGLVDFKKKYDSEFSGGAPFLGVSGCIIKAHGNSKAGGIMHAAKRADEFAKSGTIQDIADYIKDISCEDDQENDL